MKTKQPYESNFFPPGSFRQGEGNTPLVKSRKIGPELGLPNLYFKLENLNPTGSYKDRFASALVGHMLAEGQKICIATTSGNTGAALAAYCAAADLPCIVLVVDGAPPAKLKQMQVYGAQVIMVQDFGLSLEVSDQVYQGLNSITTEHRLSLPISAYKYCPEGMAGVESIGKEIAVELPGNLEVFIPAGGGGLTLAIARGITEITANGKVNCVQPEGNDTIASSLRKGIAARSVSRSTTKVSGLQVANVLDGDRVIEICRRTGGTGYAVSDSDVFRWQRLLAEKEGIFSEPAGVVALAGLADAVARKEADPASSQVCVVTGSGFKDLTRVETAFNLPETQPVSLRDTWAVLQKVLLK